MSNSYFQFKQFIIQQDKCAMKVGTDGVLLGAWTEPENAQRILDIGTGTGLIALMVAQRSNALIDAIDMDEGAYIQSKENIQMSPFNQRIRTFHSSLSHFKNNVSVGSYDLIISNPPYFTNSLKSPDIQRNAARHTDSLSLNDLIEDSLSLLNPNGRISLILPSENENHLIHIIEQNSLHIIRSTDIITTQGNTPKRFLVELSHSPNPDYQKDSLTIEVSRHEYTSEYRTLTKDYYLHL